MVVPELPTSMQSSGGVTRPPTPVTSQGPFFFMTTLAPSAR